MIGQGEVEKYAKDFDVDVSAQITISNHIFSKKQNKKNVFVFEFDENTVEVYRR